MAVKVLGGRNWRKCLQDIVDQKTDAHIGVLEGATYSGERGTKAGQSVAQVAAYMEWGTDTIPARSPMAKTAMVNRSKWRKGISALLQKKTTQKDALVKAVETVAEVAVKDMQEQIQATNPPALKPATVKNKRRKGRANPDQMLIDTGTYQQAIDREVFVRGQKR